MLHYTFVKQPSDNCLPSTVQFDQKLTRMGCCIYVLDGTHINAYIVTSRHNRWYNVWRNQKDWTSQNVFAAVRSDETFSYVLTGAEGFMHDSNLLETRYPVLSVRQ